MEMKSATIHLHGIPGIDKPQPIKTVYFSAEQQLKDHLKNLQAGYCEGEKPKITEYKHPETGKLIFDCEGGGDFHYVARCGYKLKESANKPIEYLNN